MKTNKNPRFIASNKGHCIKRAFSKKVVSLMIAGTMNGGQNSNSTKGISFYSREAEARGLSLVMASE